MRRRRWGTISASLVLSAGAISGCGDGGSLPSLDPSPHSQTRGGGNAPPPTPPEPKVFGPGVVTVMWCTNNGSGRAGLIHAYSTTDGRLVARQRFTPTGEPAYLCSPHSIPRTQQQVRQLFDKDFTMLAGTVRGAGGQGAKATAFELATGRPVGPTPDPDAFGSAARQSDPAFRPGTNTLVYRDGKDRTLARDVRAPDTAAVDLGPSDGSGFLLAGPDLWTPVPSEALSPGAVTVSPAGDLAVGYDQVHRLRMWRHGEDPDTATALGPGQYGSTLLPGEKVPSVCVPRFWRDDTSFVCGDQRTLSLVTFTADRRRVSTVQTLIPDSNRNNHHATLAKDGRTVAFVSVINGERALFRLDLSTPNTAPVKITDLPRPENSDGVIPHILAWE